MSTHISQAPRGCAVEFLAGFSLPCSDAEECDLDRGLGRAAGGSPQP